MKTVSSVSFGTSQGPIALQNFHGCGRQAEIQFRMPPNATMERCTTKENYTRACRNTFQLE